MEFNVLIGGQAGQGMFSVELELTEILSSLRYHFFATKNYMSRIRGGHNFHMIRVAEEPVHALSGVPWDLVIGLDTETERYHRTDLSASGIFLSQGQVKEMEQAARERFEQITVTNTMLAGLILSVIGCPPERLYGIRDISLNQDHLAAGFEFARRWGLEGRCPVEARASAHCGSGPRGTSRRLPVHGRLPHDAGHLGHALRGHRCPGTPRALRAGRG